MINRRPRDENDVKENKEPTRKQKRKESLGERDIIKAGASRDRWSLKRIQDPRNARREGWPKIGVFSYTGSGCREGRRRLTGEGFRGGQIYSCAKIIKR